MKKRICVKPHKVSATMKKFLNTASDLTYKKGSIPMDKAWEDEKGEWHWNDEDIEWSDEKKEMRVHRKPDSFCAMLTPGGSVEDSAVGYILYDFQRIFGKQQFCEYWRSAIPMLKGFADITLLLLHELGHFETDDEIREVFSVEDREQAIKDIEKQFTIVLDNTIFIDNESINECYFELPDEYAASEWGFNWLKDPEHRKIAKAFEKEFFACFEEDPFTGWA